MRVLHSKGDTQGPTEGSVERWEAQNGGERTESPLKRVDRFRGRDRKCRGADPTRIDGNHRTSTDEEYTTDPGRSSFPPPA